MDDKKIAVLIDAENVSGKYIKLILDESAIMEVRHTSAFTAIFRRRACGRG